MCIHTLYEDVIGPVLSCHVPTLFLMGMSLLNYGLFYLCQFYQGHNYGMEQGLPVMLKCVGDEVQNIIRRARVKTGV